MTDYVTVKELLQLCQREIEKGNGDKEIFISDDDEGNGYHGLWYSFQDNDMTKQYGYNPKKQILLG